MAKNILITGGAGFIGSHLADVLIASGHRVRVLDNLCEQVHGADAKPPTYLHPEIEFMHGDIRNRDDVSTALQDIELVYHFAAKVGVGQSMYEIAEYTDVNNIGTAVLLEALTANPAEKLVVASSMSIYGEGLYRRSDNRIVDGYERNLDDIRRGMWELMDEEHNELAPVPTGEEKNPAISSVYALSKYDQERMCLMIGRAYNMPVAALRFFNVYGTRQALSNPYTGVLAIFASRYLNNNQPLIFEDGNQRRDFVHVADVAQACILAGFNAASSGHVFNIGSGTSFTINQIASLLAEVMGKADIQPSIPGKYRQGDIRHCFADIAKARQILGFEPRVSINNGLEELAQWLKNQKASDHVDKARSELEKRGLAV
jgi:dTDP-L-rhamnose 4-epimerase